MAQTVQMSFHDVLVEKIRDLGIFDDSKEVQARDMPDDWSNPPPRGISVMMHSEVEGAGTSGKDDYGYRFLVVFSAGTSKGSGDNREWISVARDKVRKQFNNKRLVDIVPQSFVCGVRNDDFLKKRPWESCQAISVLVITCWAREVRP